MFKALSNPNRLEIFLQLYRCMGAGQKHPTDDAGISGCQLEFAEILGLAPSTVSHHFKELRNAGLIVMERQGKSIVCWIEPRAVDTLRSFLETTPISEQFGQCAKETGETDE